MIVKMIKKYFGVKYNENFYEDEESNSTTVYTKIDPWHGTEDLADVFIKNLNEKGYEKTKRWLAHSHWTPKELYEFVEEHGRATEVATAFEFYQRSERERDEK
jgi:hypoxanthine phosphoribosyltransferase